MNTTSRNAGGENPRRDSRNTVDTAASPLNKPKGGHYFVVQAVGGKESSLFPMSNEDMADWTERFLRDVKGIWPGPQS